MLFTDLFEGRDMCNVCGQTPCNCTHVMESVGDTVKGLYNKIYNAAVADMIRKDEGVR